MQRVCFFTLLHDERKVSTCAGIEMVLFVLSVSSPPNKHNTTKTTTKRQQPRRSRRRRRTNDVKISPKTKKHAKKSKCHPRLSLSHTASRRQMTTAFTPQGEERKPPPLLSPPRPHPLSGENEDNRSRLRPVRRVHGITIVIVGRARSSVTIDDVEFL